MEIAETSSTIVSETEIASLPSPIQRYMRYSGIIGKERISYFTLKWSGDFKLGKDKDWLSIEAEQISYIPEPQRIFYIKGYFWGFIPVSGRDLYKNRRGEMLIELMSLITVAHDTTDEINYSALVTFLDDMIFCPSAFLESRIQWEELSDSSARATISDGDLKVSGVFYVNKTGQITKMVTKDRYYSEAEQKPVKVPWTTPFSNYKEINGIRIPTYGEGIWNLAEGDFRYAKFHIKEYKTY